MSAVRTRTMTIDTINGSYEVKALHTVDFASLFDPMRPEIHNRIARLCQDRRLGKQTLWDLSNAAANAALRPDLVPGETLPKLLDAVSRRDIKEVIRLGNARHQPPAES